MLQQPLADGRERATERWGKALDVGFTIIPDLLLKNQRGLGLTSRELLVLLQLLTFWWKASTPPRPRVTTLANRLDVDERTVQRALSALCEKGFVERVRVKTPDGDDAQGFNLSGLVAKLERLAQNSQSQPEFSAV